MAMVGHLMVDVDVIDFTMATPVNIKTSAWKTKTVEVMASVGISRQPQPQENSAIVKLDSLVQDAAKGPLLSQKVFN